MQLLMMSKTDQSKTSVRERGREARDEGRGAGAGWRASRERKNGMDFFVRGRGPACAIRAGGGG